MVKNAVETFPVASCRTPGAFAPAWRFV